MESQRCGAVGEQVRRISVSRRCRPWRHVLVSAVWLLCSAMLIAGTVHAQSTRYVYDANGRVVAVTANNGTSVQYSYNTLGHASQISAPLSPGQLAIFAFMPTHGEAGTPVTIQGQGFDNHVANDTVSFNGTVATVLSATATQLVTTVPDGATTGPITVTVGSRTASTPALFVVDSTGIPPAITQVTPTTVAVGSVVTITGTDLAPVPGETVVQLGNTAVAISSASSTQLQFVVPPTATGGYVKVTTPYGQAISPSFIAVLPPAVSPSQLVSSGSAALNGSSATLTIGAGGQVGVVSFNASVGNWLSVQLSNIATAASQLNYTVYGPNGSVVLQGAASTQSPSIHLPQLTTSGIYMVAFQPSNAGAQLSVSVVTDAVLDTTTPLSESAAAPWQSERFIFTATAANQNIELTLNEVNSPNNGYNSVVVYVYNANGTEMGGVTCPAYNPSASCQQHLWGLPTGVYEAYVIPNQGGTPSFNIMLATDTVMPPLTRNTPVAVSIPTGHVQRFTFNASAGETVALQGSGAVVPAASGSGITYSVFRPDAGLISVGSTPYVTFDSTNTTIINLPNLPIGGTYTVIASPDYGLGANGQMGVATGVTGNLTTNGAPANYAGSVAGQNVYMPFTATQGENLELTLNHLTLTGGGNFAYVYVYDASGAQIMYFSCYTYNPGGSCQTHLWNLTAGNYSAVVAPQAGNSASFNALLQDDVVGPGIATNGNAPIDLTAGQVERFTFNATAGQTLALNVSGVTTTPSGQGITVNVYRPDVGDITDGTAPYATYDTANTPTVNLPNLPVAGTYTVIVSPDYGVAASGQLNVVARAGGTLVNGGAAQAEATGVSMQNVYMTFNANQGDNLELTLNNLSFSTSNYLNVQVLDATGHYVNGMSCSTGMNVPSCSLHLWNLNAGTYSVTATPSYGGTYSFNAVLLPDMVGPGLQANSPVKVNLVAGQVERLSFSATQGQTVSLQLSNISVAPTGNGVGIQFLIYSPNVGLISTGTAKYSYVDTTGSYTFNLPNLPLTGSYTVIVAPDSGVSATAQLNLVSGVTGAVPVDGTQQSYASMTSGQNVYLSFAAQQGANLELTLNNLTANGSGAQGASITVFNSAGMQVGSFADYTSYPNGSNILPLWDLPAGTYSIVISPTSSANGGVMNFNVMLQPDLIGPNLSSSGSSSISLGAGQVARYTFNANAGDTVTLQFSQVAITPSGTDIWLPVSIYRPDVGTITTSTSIYNSTNVTGDSATITLANLPVSGSYTVIVGADHGLAATGQIYMTDAAGSGPVYSTPTLPNDGTLQSETGSGAGQSVTMTFNASAGQAMEVNLSGINVVGAAANGVRVDVYNPAGGDMYGYYCYASSPNAGCRQQFYMAVAGTYKIVVSAPWGGTLNFNTQVQPAIVEGGLSANTPVAVNLAQGQVQRFTFNANAGDNVALSLSNASTSPSGQPVFFDVLRPDQGPNPPAYASASTSGGSAYLNLNNLPTSGAYTVEVFTPYGEAGNTTLTFVPVTPTALTENGAAQHVTASIAGQATYATFTAGQGDNLELTLANLVAAGGSSFLATATVYGPNGNQVSYANCYQSNPGNDCRLSLWNLAAGTYSIAITPSTNVVMSFDLLLLSDIHGPTLALGIPSTINLGLGQVQRVTFNGTQGSTYALNLSGTSTTPGGQYVNVTVYRPDVGTLTSGNYYTYTNAMGGTTINLPDLPVSGTYAVTVCTIYGQPGQVTLNLLPGVTGQLATGAPPQTFSTNVAGQNAYLTFKANAGDNLELLFSGISGSYTVNVYSSIGTQIGSTLYCYASNPGSSCMDSLWNLQADTYSIVITGGPATFTTQLASDVDGPALTANTPTTINLAAGEVQRLTFNGTQGSPVVISLSGSSTTPSSQNVYACVYRPDTGTPNANDVCNNYYLQPYAQLNTSSNQALNISSLPATGTYTVVVGQGYGLPSSMQLVLTTGMTGTLANDGTVSTFAATTSDENYYTSFTANPGDNLELAFSNIAVPHNSFTGGLTVNVTDQNGHAVTTNSSCTASSTCIFSYWNLAGGTYHVVVSPTWGGTMSFDAQLTPDIIEPALVPNTPTAVNLPQGRVARYTLNGSAGQSVNLNLSAVTTSPGNPMYIYVYRPDVGAIVQNSYGSASSSNAYVWLETTTSGTISLPSLPISGNYTVIVASGSGIAATAQLTVTTNAAIPSLTSGGPVQGVLLTSAMNAVLNFNANSNDNLELSLNNIVAEGGNNGAVAMTVFDSNGNVVTQFNCYASSPGASCIQSLWNLTQGAYTVVASTMSGGTVRFNAQLQPDVDAGPLAVNTPVQIGPNAAPSPVERFTFDANAGSTVSLQLASVKTTPSGQSMSVSVYRPDAGVITTSNAYQQFNATSANTLSMANLPVSGTYTVIVNTPGAVGSVGQLTLKQQ